MTLTIVVQNTKSVQNYSREGTVNFSYTLPEALHFDEPHFARLVWLGGSKKSCLVFADFVKTQYVNGQLEPFLGCSGSSAIGSPWIPLASSYIPSFGFIKVRPTNFSSLSEETKLTLIVEIHGAPSTPGL